VIQAFLYTACAFTSFSALALFSKRRSYLFLGGIILTMIQAMALYRLFSWLFGYQAHFNMLYIMGGLLSACLYVIYDTQVIIERAERGDKDEISHALTLFLDLFDLFIKILRVLMELQKRQEEDNRNKKRKN
jgi:FtsH-binding integral membrane protein